MSKEGIRWLTNNRGEIISSQKVQVDDDLLSPPPAPPVNEKKEIPPNPGPKTAALTYNKNNPEHRVILANIEEGKGITIPNRRKTYWLRKEMGLCVRCGLRPIDKGHNEVLCVECLSIASKSQVKEPQKTVVAPDTDTVVASIIVTMEVRPEDRIALIERVEELANDLSVGIPEVQYNYTKPRSEG